ncbi:MAG: hypothetical protein IKP65_08670 [Alphaproteobacteria bacterium]|nr:hypothetical protein [Alphaproteobacteria bacterium]
MNIFVILIMAVMLATYQYFTTKRSSDVVLNKDELKLQAELTCMKQYHEFATSRNEYITQTGDTVVSLKGTGENKVNYTCTGSDDATLAVSKYCINPDGSKKNCNTAEAQDIDFSKQTTTPATGFHCVSTTKWKTFDTSDKYLMSQILKANVQIATLGTAPTAGFFKLKDKVGYFTNPTANTDSSNDDSKTTIGIGIVSCVDERKVFAQIKMKENKCPEGTTPTLINNEWICAQNTDASPCTNYEKEIKDKDGKFTLNIDGKNYTYSGVNDKINKTKCTKISDGKYCCAINEFYGISDANYDTKCKVDDANKRPANCCPEGLDKTWDDDYRYYKCSNVKDYCKGTSKMIWIDENSIIKGELTVGYDNEHSAATPQYNKEKQKFECKLKYQAWVDACKAKQEDGENGISFLKIDELKNNTVLDASTFEINKDTSAFIGTKFNKEQGYAKFKNSNVYRPVCVTADANNAKSSENCNPCQGVEFDKINNKWKCKDYTENDLKNKDILEKLSTERTSKGTKGCLIRTCSDNQRTSIKKGIFNGKYWGLRYDSDSKMWGCFTCNPKNTHNSMWKFDSASPCGFDMAPQNTESVDIEQSSNSMVNSHTAACNIKTTPGCSVPTQNSSTGNGTCSVYYSLESNYMGKTNGKCVPFNCDPVYQIQLANGQCYTKWCTDIPKNAPGISVNIPKERACPSNASWMIMNPEKNCVYCIVPSSYRIDNPGTVIQSTNN